MRSTWRNSVFLSLASTIIVGASTEVWAHRRDEYLQAARIALAPERVHIELDLTAGIAVAETVLADIDRDRTGTISADEVKAYAAAVREAIALEVDGTPVSVQVVSSSSPGADAVRKGEGTIRIELIAGIPPLSAGAHHLRYRNGHRRDIGVYLANVLVPGTDRVTVSGQRRDAEQRELIVDFEIDPVSRERSWFLAGIAGMALALASLWRRSRTK